MANTIKYVAAGLDAVHAAYRADTGAYMAGWSNLTTSSTAGTGSGMRKLTGAQDFPLAPQDTNVVQVRGDDGLQGTFQFESDSPITGQLVMGVKDLTFSAATRGETALAIGEWTMVAEDGSPTAQPNLMYLVTRRAISKDSATDGAALFENRLWYNCQTIDKGSALSYQADAKFNYNITANKSAYTAWGTTCAASFNSTYKCSTVWVSTNRTMLHCWVADGTAMAVTVDYTPVSSAKSKAYKVSDGSALTVSSVSAGSKTITLSAAPTTGTVVVLIYECTSYA